MTSIDFESDSDTLKEPNDDDDNDYYGRWKNFTLKLTTNDAPDHVKDASFVLNRINLSDVTIETKGGIEYKLEKVTLASKSIHFEKVFNSQSQGDNEIERIIFDVVDDHIFPDLVDIIYEKADLKSIINKDNYVQLLQGMVALIMEIDLGVFEEFINEIIKPKKQFDENMFEMLNFITSYSQRKHYDFDYLLPTVLKYFSDRLLQASERKEFLSVQYEGLLRILENRSERSKERGYIASICADWISHQFQQRIDKLTTLVNAVRYRYDEFYRPISEQWSITSTVVSSDEARRAKIEENFNDLLYYDGEINFDTNPGSSCDFYKTLIKTRVLFPIDQPTRWMAFLRSEYLCDVAIDVQETTFKLHKIKLSLASKYFCQLFTEQVENLKFKEDRKPGTISCHYSLDKIDSTTFTKLVQYIYKGEVEITSETDMINLFKASKLLKMDQLYDRCYSWIMKIAPKLTTHLLEIFQFVCENEKYTELYDVLVDCIITQWSKLNENKEFKTIPFEVLKEILALPKLQIDEPNEILDLCSEWIFEDVENRYERIVELAKAINRNSSMKIEQFKLKLPSKSGDYSLTNIKKQLTEILNSATLISPLINPLTKEQTPIFILIKNKSTLSIVNANFEEIVTIHPRTYAKNSIKKPSATAINDKLFILFNIGEKFYFQVYHQSSKQFISLATDDRMLPFADNYVILNVKNEIHFCANNTILRYSVQLNRWISLWRQDYALKSEKWYASDGRQFYSVCYRHHRRFRDVVPEDIRRPDDLLLMLVRVCDSESFYLKKLPGVPLTNDLIRSASLQENFSINVGIINNDLSILFESKTFLLNSVSKTWSSILNPRSDFFQFTSYESNILYVSRDKEVHSFSIISNEWKLLKKLSDCEEIVVIHRVN